MECYTITNSMNTLSTAYFNSKIKNLDTQIKNLDTQIKNLDTQIKNLDTQMKEKQNTIEDLIMQVNQQEEKLKKPKLDEKSIWNFGFY